MTQPIDLVQLRSLRGLGLPAIKGAGGLFDTKTRYDVVWSDLLIAIWPAIGSRFMRRSAGSALTEQLFDPISPDPQLIGYVIRDAVSKQAPHINIRDVRVAQSESQDVALEVSIIFGVTGEDGDEQQTVLIPKSFSGGI